MYDKYGKFFICQTFLNLYTDKRNHVELLNARRVFEMSETTLGQYRMVFTWMFLAQNLVRLALGMEMIQYIIYKDL